MSDQGSANGAAIGVLDPDAATFVSFDPASGDQVAAYPNQTPEEVAAAVAEARKAFAWWSGLTWAERKRRLRRWAGEIVRGQDELCELIHRENGKPLDDAFREMFLAVEHIGRASGHARSVLRPRGVSTGMLMANHGATLEYQPLGVGGVIGPWNYPALT